MLDIPGNDFENTAKDVQQLGTRQAWEEKVAVSGNVEVDSSQQSTVAKMIHDAKSFPILTPAEEQNFAKRLRDAHDDAAREALINPHLRLVIKIASGYKGYGLPLTDLIGVGNEGLIKAVDKFDIERGFRLSTYAMWWIRAAIKEYVLKNWSLVKMGTMADQKKLFFRLNKAKRKLGIAEDVLTPQNAEDIARHTGTKVKNVMEMDQRLQKSPSLDVPINVDGVPGETWKDQLEDVGANQEEVLAEQEELEQRKEWLAQALGKLGDREKAIFTQRKLQDPPTTLVALGEQYGISRERVRQLEVRAFEKVQKAMRELMLQNVEAAAAALAARDQLEDVV